MTFFRGYTVTALVFFIITLLSVSGCGGPPEDRSCDGGGCTTTNNTTVINNSGDDATLGDGNIGSDDNTDNSSVDTTYPPDTVIVPVINNGA